MLERRRTSGGVVLYESPLLRARGVPHAFSTRVGGLSPAPFDSLNLGNPNGCDRQDDVGRIAENYALLQDAIGCADRTRCWVHQVHGGDVISIRRGEEFESGPKADGLASDDPSRLLAVRVADCVPVLLATDDGRAVAAAHAGWRGVIAGVVAEAARQMQTLVASPSGSSPRGSIVAAIGPCIGFEAFEVGAEVVEQFERAFGANAPFIRRRDDGKGHVDLRAAIARHLVDLGVSAERIDATDRCTVRDADEFFSHRRDHGVTGRMAALIGTVKA